MSSLVEKFKHFWFGNEEETEYEDGFEQLFRVNNNNQPEHEQKKRRYMGDLISYLQSHKMKQFTWSKNNISPGTDFMKDLMTFLSSKKFTDRIKKYCLNYKVSGPDEEGEGEFKILQIIDTLPIDDSIVV